VTRIARGSRCPSRHGTREERGREREREREREKEKERERERREPIGVGGNKHSIEQM